VRPFLGVPSTLDREGPGRLSAPHRRRRFRLHRTRRGVSDVVATILLLALTVTLFSAIFAFVSSFPAPPAQNSNQFQASLQFNTGGSKVVGLNITHLAGPQVPGNALIYLKSAVHPSDCPFSGSVSVSSGISGQLWNLGQVWSKKFTAWPGCGSYGGDTLPDNITVFIVSASNLIFSVILPGQGIVVPPTITGTWTVPTTPVQGQAFKVFATISGTLGSNRPFVNLGGITGYPTTASLKMWFNSTAALWQFNVTAGNTTTTPIGTYTGFVNVTSSSGATATAILTVTIISSAGNGPLSVAVVLVPSPPNSGTKESVQAVVTYTGSQHGDGLTVSFYANSTPSGNSWAGSTGPSGLTISGPSSVTVTSLATWTIPGPNSAVSYLVSASASVVGVGTVTGTMSFTPALITLSTAGPGLVGSSVTVTGSAFAASTGVVLSLGGVSITPSSCSSGTLSGATVTATGGGAFVCTIAVPKGSPAGATTVLASDATSGQNDTAAYTVTAWTVSLSLASGLLGSSTTATGAGFAGASGVTFAVDGISVTPTSCSTGTLVGATVTTTAAGAFVCALTIPYGATAGAGTVTSTDSSWSQVVSSTYTVTAWTIALSPTSSSHSSATTVTITGAGFAGSTGVSIVYNGAVVTPVGCTSGTVSGNTITSTAAGGLICTYTIAIGSAGIYPFSLIDATSGQSATAYYTRT
jgi:flagellin-like protein